jgi:hypothetical protein
MIQNVSQIEKEFLIKTLVTNKQPVRFHGFTTAGTGLITMMDRLQMAVTLLETFDNTSFSVCEHITGYFDCHGTTYAFETTVRDCQKQQIKIDAPVKLLRSLQREFVRVRKPKDIQVLFHLANEEIQLDYPVCPEYISVDEIGSGSAFSGKKLNEMIESFKEKIKDKCKNTTIIMFRNRKPENYEEELISNTGKVLFIPSTSSQLPKNDPYPEGRIITETIEETFEPPDFFIAGSKFEKLLKNKKNQGIASEIWCPIVYYQYVVGYIYLVNSGSESFDIAMVDYIWDFSRVLAWELKRTGYFQIDTKISEPIKHKAKILDMSPGGMLISLPATEIRTPIREGSFFSVEITLEKNIVQCSAKVARRFEEKGAVSYGTTFINLTPENMMNLYEFLYKRPFNEKDPHAFEQKKRSLH